MRKLTSEVRIVGDNEFLKLFLDKRQKKLTCEGGNVFGKAVKSPNELAKIVLGLMICFFFGGK